MKKKLFTIALALCMVFTMIPAGVFQVETAWAESGDTPTHVEVAGVEMVDNAATKTFYKIGDTAASTEEPTDYDAMYNKDTNTLTLKGFTYNGSKMGVYADGNLNIVVDGENTITSTKYGIWTTGDLTISGTNSTTDKLNVTSSGRNAIFAFEDDTDKFFNYAESINISHVSINALADGGDVGIGAPNTVTIKNSYVVSTGKEHGIQGGYFRVSDGGNGARGNIIITNSVIKAEATSEGANALEKTVTVNGSEYNHKNAQIVNIPDVHEHCICGGSVSSGGHVHDSNVTWTKWAETTSLPDAAGNYYLTEDVTLSNIWYPKDGTVLCLSGHTITENGNFNLIGVEGGKSFTLTDCELGGKKGSVTHASGAKGSGVYTLGNFTMYGGTISGNEAISKSGLAAGGGVQVNGSSLGASSFTMYGGTISGNTATSGGGIYLNEGNSFTMYGGSIFGNRATSNGGGVYVKGTITLSGTSRIFANTNDYYKNKKDNVCLRDNASITIKDTLSGEIGVNKSFDTKAGDVIATGADENTDYSNIIISDRDEFEIACDSSNKTILVLKTKDTPNPTKHEHYLCGTECKAIGDHQTEDSEITFDKKIWMDGETLKIDDTPWTKDATSNVDWYKLPAGSYYLDGNIELDASILTEGRVNLCLNGNTITGGAQGQVITVGTDSEFALTDCRSVDKQGNITHKTSVLGKGVYNSGKFFLYGGNIIGNDSYEESNHTVDFNGGGLQNHNGATFTMYGGSITGNKATNGAGVYNAAQGTYPTKDTVFKMYGGTISGNQAYIAGGVYNQGNFIMEGGSINANTATNTGGGVYISSNTTSPAGTFTMKDGEIVGNTAGQNAGGVFVDVDTDGALKSTFKISGDVNITGNKANDKDNNVYLGMSSENGVVKTASIEIDNAVTTISQKIGVTTAKTPTEEVSVVIVSPAKEVYKDYFKSDDSNYVIAYEGKQLVLKINANPPATEHKHCICGETHQNIGDHNSDNAVTFTAWDKTDSLPTEAGNYYLTGNVTLSEEWIIPENKEITLCMSSYSILLDENTKCKKTNNNFIIYISPNGKLTLTSCKADSKIENTAAPSSYNGIHITENAALDLYNVTLTNFKGTSTGMGIWNEGTFNMYSGAVRDNLNSVQGIRNDRTGSFNMYGGTITGNPTGVYNLGTVKLSGNVTIKDNTKNLMNLKDNGVTGIVKLDNLGDSALIGITTYPSPKKGNPVIIVSSGAKAADVAKFFVDNDASNEYEIYLSKAGELSIGVKGDKKPSTGGGGSSIQRPTIIADEGANASLNYNGSRLTIDAKDGYEITDVLVNGVSKGAVTELTGLKTGDKVEVKTAKKAEPTDPAADKNAKLIKGIENTTIVLKSKLTKNKNVLLTWTKSKGYKVDKFEFYRSVKKSSGYGKAAFFTTKDGSWSKYLNNKELKAGKTYYYKVRGVRVIDGQKYYTQWSNKAWRTIK